VSRSCWPTMLRSWRRSSRCTRTRRTCRAAASRHMFLRGSNILQEQPGSGRRTLRQRHPSFSFWVRLGARWQLTVSRRRRKIVGGDRITAVADGHRSAIAGPVEVLKATLGALCACALQPEQHCRERISHRLHSVVHR